MYLLRRPILALSSRPRIRDGLTGNPLTRGVVDRFIPGSTMAEAVQAVRLLRAQGLQVSLDHLGEGVADEPGAAANVRAYLDILDALAAADLVTGSEVSVKLSAVGQALPAGEELALNNATDIVRAAYNHGARVTLDMEDHSTVDSTLRVLMALRQDFPDVGVAIQAMLHRTVDDLAELTGKGSRVRLVKGAYNEPETVAYQGAGAVDLAYVRALKLLMAGEGHPMIGTHDPRLIAIAQRLAITNARPPESFEHQLLYGIRVQEQVRLAEHGHLVRVYVPYGSDWYGYFTRRLAERPANLLFFVRSMLSRG